MKVMIFADLKV